MKRALRTLIRIIAAALVVFGVLELALSYAGQREGSEIGWTLVILGVALIAAGLILLTLSANLAEKFTDDFDE